jgi:uncharacterized membrane protein
MREFIRNRRAETNYIVSVIMLITVMMATIIGGIVFFAFADGTSGMQQSIETYTGTGANTSVFYWKLLATPGSTPAWNISITNGVTTKYAGASNYTYISANNTIKTNAQFFRYGYTSITITFATHAKDAVSKVILYAIVVFAMIAIVPMIMVGGLMLRSLGFMGGGTGKV